jgi:hypothetical protein
MYTGDSCPCRAARHVGVLDPPSAKGSAAGAAGCVFVVKKVPPNTQPEVFEGSTKNGVTSHSCGAYPNAITVAKA